MRACMLPGICGPAIFLSSQNESALLRRFAFEVISAGIRHRAYGRGEAWCGGVGAGAVAANHSRVSSLPRAAMAAAAAGRALLILAEQLLNRLAQMARCPRMGPQSLWARQMESGLIPPG